MLWRLINATLLDWKTDQGVCFVKNVSYRVLKEYCNLCDECRRVNCAKSDNNV